ncbi:MAG: heme ABC transporter permease [Alphaproteobacteria bacterium]|nr:MAG: heme ABC transporter permease [Alphaproteobacteria bacterium]
MTAAASLSRFANPRRFLSLVKWLLPLSWTVAGLCLAGGAYAAFFGSPPDYQQGETVRIMYIHVPAAWMALFIYTTMAVAALTGLVWKHIVAELYAKAVAPVGAAFTFLCLVTGSLWGRPMWGAWWAWDARLTSVLILFFLYIGYIALVDAFDDEQRGLNAGAGLLLIGAVNIPIIKFSVDWFNTLHQPASIMRLGAPTIDGSMLAPLALMALGFQFLFVALACLRLKTEITLRRRRTKEMAA